MARRRKNNFNKRDFANNKAEYLSNKIIINNNNLLKEFKPTSVQQ